MNAPLQQPLTLPCGLTLPNRIGKSAMSECLADAGGVPSERLARLYGRWSTGGAGLLITGNVMVDPGGLGESGNVIIQDTKHLKALQRWAESAQAHGTRLFMQINHAGRQSPRNLVKQPVGPSPIAIKLAGAFAVPRELSDSDISTIIKQFAATASVAKEAGFAGVQIHGAHGYLVSQFLSPRANHRTDRWGGPLENRMRFLLDMVDAMRAAVGPEYPVTVKMNSADFQRGGFAPEEAVTVAQALERAGVDLLEISGGSYEAPAMTRSGEMLHKKRDTTAQREAYFLDYAKQIRAATKFPLMLTGGMRSAQVMNDVVTSGAVDVVGLARPMAFEPDLPKKILSGESDAAQVVKIRSRVKTVDDLMQIYWYQAQLHRMAAGMAPNPELGSLRALWHAVKQNLPSRPAASA